MTELEKTVELLAEITRANVSTPILCSELTCRAIVDADIPAKIKGALFLITNCRKADKQELPAKSSFATSYEQFREYFSTEPKDKREPNTKDGCDAGREFLHELDDRYPEHFRELYPLDTFRTNRTHWRYFIDVTDDENRDNSTIFAISSPSANSGKVSTFKESALIFREAYERANGKSPSLAEIEVIDHLKFKEITSYEIKN